MEDHKSKRTQVKRDQHNQVRVATLSLPHNQLYFDIKHLYEDRFDLSQVSFSTMVRRGLELLHDHLETTQSIPLEQQLFANAKSGRVNKL